MILWRLWTKFGARELMEISSSSLFLKLSLSLFFFQSHGCFSQQLSLLFFYFLFLINSFIYLFLAALGLCCARAFSSCSQRGLLFVEVHGLLIVVASLVAEHGLQARRLLQLWHVDSVVVARGLQTAVSVVVAHRLSFSVACGIFPDQGLNLCTLHWQADS